MRKDRFRIVAWIACAAWSIALTAPAGAAEGVVLRRTPVPGERVVHAFVLDRDLVAQQFKTRSRGEEQSSQDQIEFGGRSTLRIVDEIREVEGARASVFRRRIEDAAVKVDMRLTTPGGTPRAQTIQGTSPLANSSVLFRWIPARDAYGRLYDGIETSEEFLPRLEPEIDLACLLPSGPVEPEAVWAVDPVCARRLFGYGGFIPFRFAKGGDPLLARTAALGVAGPLHEVALAETTGSIRARLVSVEGGVARIALELDLRVRTDQAAVNQEMLSPPERYDGLRVDSALAEWTFRGVGELRWLARDGRAQALTLSGAEELRLDVAMDGPKGKGGSDLRLAGGLKLSIDVSASPPPGPR